MSSDNDTFVNDAENIMKCIISSVAEVISMLLTSMTHVNKNGDEAIDGIYVNCNDINTVQSPFRTSIEVLSSIVLIILMFMTKRVSFLNKICYGRPGVVVPMKPLESHEHGIEYTLAFLAISEFLYAHIVDSNSNIETFVPILKFLTKLGYVLLLALISYPFFVAITYRNLIVYLLGIISLMMTLSSALLTSYYSIKCKTIDKAVTTLFKTLFSTLFIFILLCILIWRAIIHVMKNRCKLTDDYDYHSNDEYLCLKYVKNLITCRLVLQDTAIVPEIRGFVSKYSNFINFKGIKSKLTSNVYHEIPGFKIPPRLMIGLSVGSYFAYHIAIDKIDDFTPVTWNFLRLISEKYYTTKMDARSAFAIIYSNDSNLRYIDYLNAYRHITFLYVHVMLSCTVSALVIAFGNAIIHSFLILRNYRLHFHTIAKRGFSDMLHQTYTPQTDNLVLGFAKFSGFQAAFILWSIMVVFTILSVLLFIVIGVVLIPLFYIDNSWVRNALKSFGPVLIVSFLFYFFQKMLIKYVFVKERGTVMEINNKRAFDVYCHMAFFFNVIMGFFGSLQRVIIWMFSGVICFGRIDFTFLPQYIQRLDSGFMCYVGFLYTEQYHYNPILRGFAYLLMKAGKESTLKTCINKKLVVNCDNGSISESKRINYVIKWHVAYTLIKNPQLISMKKIFKNQ